MRVTDPTGALKERASFSSANGFGVVGQGSESTRHSAVPLKATPQRPMKSTARGAGSSHADVLSELKMMQRGKRELEEKLGRVERQIFDIEASYLEETWSYGNVVRGWDGFVKRELKSDDPGLSVTRSVAFGGGSNPTRFRKMKDSDRIFSKSSVTAPTKGSLSARTDAPSAQARVSLSATEGTSPSSNRKRNRSSGGNERRKASRSGQKG